MFRKFFLPIMVFTLGTVLLWEFRLPILMRAWPGYLLQRAAADAMQDIRERFTDDPLELLRRSLDFDGNIRILCNFRYQDPTLGTSIWDLDVSLQEAPPALMSAGTIQISGRTIPLGIYLDETYGALRLSETRDTVWYGITYAPFLETIERSPFLKKLLDEYPEALHQWLGTGDKIPSVPQISIPDFSLEPLQKATIALSLLHWDVSDELLSSDGTEAPIYRLHTEIQGPQLVNLIATIKNQELIANPELLDHLQKDPAGRIAATFYLREYKLQGFHVTVNAEGETFSLQVMCEGGFQDGLWELRLHYQSPDGAQDISLIVQPRQDSLEQGTLTLTSGEKWDWSWMPGTAQLRISQTPSSGSSGIYAEFCGAPQVIRIRAPNSGLLIETITGREVVNPDRFGPGFFTILTGNTIKAPAYRDFSSWSAEELFTLLELLHTLPEANQK